MLLNMPFLSSFSYGYQVPVTESIENKGGSVTDFKVSVTDNLENNSVQLQICQMCN